MSGKTIRYGDTRYHDDSLFCRNQGGRLFVGGGEVRNAEN